MNCEFNIIFIDMDIIFGGYDTMAILSIYTIYALLMKSGYFFLLLTISTY